jgi:hypothetical protein
VHDLVELVVPVINKQSWRQHHDGEPENKSLFDGEILEHRLEEEIKSGGEHEHFT